MTIVDEIAVERATAGDMDVSLNRLEAEMAFMQLESQELSAWRIGEILGVSSRTVQRWRREFPHVYRHEGHWQIGGHRKPNAAVHRVQVHLNEHEFELIRTDAAAVGMSISTFARTRLFDTT